MANCGSVLSARCNRKNSTGGPFGASGAGASPSCDLGTNTGVRAVSEKRIRPLYKVGCHWSWPACQDPAAGGSSQGLPSGISTKLYGFCATEGTLPPNNGTDGAYLTTT